MNLLNKLLYRLDVDRKAEEIVLKQRIYDYAGSKDKVQELCDIAIHNPVTLEEVFEGYKGET